MTLLRIGDTVTYRPRFGSGAPRAARVIGLTLVEYRKDFAILEQPVEAAPWELVRGREILIDLEDERGGQVWAYGDQIVGGLEDGPVGADVGPGSTIFPPEQ